MHYRLKPPQKLHILTVHRKFFWDKVEEKEENNPCKSIL